jgi:hypothetical protein
MPELWQAAFGTGTLDIRRPRQRLAEVFCGASVPQRTLQQPRNVRDELTLEKRFLRQVAKAAKIKQTQAWVSLRLYVFAKAIA